MRPVLEAVGLILLRPMQELGTGVHGLNIESFNYFRLEDSSSSSSLPLFLGGYSERCEVLLETAMPHGNEYHEQE